MTEAASARARRARSAAVSASSVRRVLTAPSVSRRRRPPAPGTHSGAPALLVAAGAEDLLVAPGASCGLAVRLTAGSSTGRGSAVAELDEDAAMAPAGGARRRARGLLERPLGRGSGAMGRAGTDDCCR